MSLSERRAAFEAAARADQFVTPATKFHKLFGVSNSAKVIGGGLQLGVVNLDNVAPGVDGFAFAGTMVFPPADEVYFAAYVRSGTFLMVARLNEMKQLGAAGGGNGAADDAGETAAERPGYAARNNNVVVVLADDGNLYLRNQGFWDALPDDRSGLGARIPVDRINVALYPPAASAQRSMLAREFVGYLGQFVGREKVHELRPWADAAAPALEMRRSPVQTPIGELEAAVAALGGHYPHGEVARYHAGLNFLPHKHFVILSGLSGTGKTQLALRYARAVHGVKSSEGPDPFLFVCPVRPEWTDPSGLTGYYDVLSNRYQVPPFLEAVLLATAHRESPVFVVLDEMNLARVEYYLSDVLSAIETGEPLQLHASGVNLEGSTGESVPATLPVPPNLYITGTINVDETTNPVSDKVLDRAVVIDMSVVDLPGFFDVLEAREPALNAARSACAPHLLAVQSLMAQHGLGFGYRVAEEAVRYQAFAADHLKLDAATVAGALAWLLLLTGVGTAGASTQVLKGRVIGVTDGDTITVLVGQVPTRVRLAEIDAPESHQPWGNRSKAALSGLVFGRSAELRVVTADRYGRSVARVFVNGTDVNATMIRTGNAWAYRRYLTDQSFLRLEAEAKAARRGLWSLPNDQIMPPWEWRHPGMASPTSASIAPNQALSGATDSHSCQGKRYCNQMTSCAEARFYLQHCGVASLDRDRDGTPCEALCAR